MYAGNDTDSYSNTQSARRSGQGRSRAGSAGTTETSGDALAQALGWFSVGLGLSQLLMPHRVAQLIGVSDDGHESSHAFMRALGARELASGVGILSQQRPDRWLQARVAGDVMDLALLGNALRSERSQRGKLLGAVAAVAGVLVLDALAGKRFSAAEGERSVHKGVTVRQRITVGRDVDEVYDFWRNFENLPRFMNHLESVQVLDGDRSHWTAKAPAGMTVEWDAEMTDDSPNERIAWRSVENATVPNTGSVRFVRAPGNRGTEVHVELEYSPPAGRLGAVVAKLFGEEPNQQVQDDLRAFKQVLEIGEVLRSEGNVRGGHAKQRPAQPPTPDKVAELGSPSTGGDGGVRTRVSSNDDPAGTFAETRA